MRKQVQQGKVWLLIGALSVLACGGVLAGCGGDGGDDDTAANGTTEKKEGGDDD